MQIGESQEFGKGQIAQRVGIIRQKHLFASQILLGGFEPLPYIGMKAAVDKCDVPFAEVILKKLQVLFCK